jgi:DNA-binding transcriptional LysR family regulator
MHLLDTVKLHTFLTITQLGSFTKAAETLNLTQPTVSQQIASMEQQLGLQLFERQPRQLLLTPAGEALLTYAERILTLNQEAVEATLEAAGLAERTLHLGVGHTLATYLLPEVLRHLRQAEPDLAVRIRVGNTADLLIATADGLVDLALVGSPAEHPQLEIYPFMEDKLVIIFNPQDRWQCASSITLEDIYTRTLITREPGSALYASVQHLLGAEFLSGPNVIVLGETEAIKRSVEAGLGIALVQGIAVQREVAQGILHTLPLAGPPTDRRYNVAQPLKQPASKAVQAFLNILGATKPGIKLT